jgi:hypothetical protein
MPLISSIVVGALLACVCRVVLLAVSFTSNLTASSGYRSSRPSSPIEGIEAIIMSASTKAALNHLKKIKPSDGWSAEARSTG